MNSHLELEVYASENGETNSLCEARNGGVAEETENKVHGAFQLKQG